MANTNNSRRVRAVKRTSRVQERRRASAQIARGDYDRMASGQRMVRQTATDTSTAPSEYDGGSSRWEV